MIFVIDFLVESQCIECECTHIIQHNLHQWQQLKLYMCSSAKIYRCGHYNSIILNCRDIFSRYYEKLICILGSTSIDWCRLHP